MVRVGASKVKRKLVVAAVKRKARVKVLAKKVSNTKRVSGISKKRRRIYSSGY